MRAVWWILVIIVGCGGGGESGQPPAQSREDLIFVAEARNATRQLQMELQKALSSALDEGGPVEALQVCSSRAAEIAQEVSRNEGLEVRRVSEDNRSPANEPNELELRVLRYFDGHPAAADTMLATEGRWVYMRPIRVGTPLCLRCHGEPDELAEGLQAQLAQLYPDDEATGFGLGDLRGAFVVEKSR